MAEGARRRDFSHRDVEAQMREQLAQIPGFASRAAAVAASFL